MKPLFKVGDMFYFQRYEPIPNYKRDWKLVWDRGVVLQVLERDLYQKYRVSRRPTVFGGVSSEDAFEDSENLMFTESEAMWVILYHGQSNNFEYRPAMVREGA